MIGNLYTCKDPADPKKRVIVKILQKWNGPGPRNVLVEEVPPKVYCLCGFEFGIRTDATLSQDEIRLTNPRRWVRPFRGMRKFQDEIEYINPPGASSLSGTHLKPEPDIQPTSNK